ncbi:MAG TPA: hypothetical protein VH436_09660 [Vicinamibacterales bacterium]|jgi:hypothetical protein
MQAKHEPPLPLSDPLAGLERTLIEAYAAGAGYDVGSLRARTDETAREVLRNASLYASEKLAEVEARSHYLHSLKGEV